ncbi:MAG: hypothetical protein JKY08_04160 [Flavobacteriaceae bacterium]|nr:hypothetical protein [Flavobacteriaceae bacterium]
MLPFSIDEYTIVKKVGYDIAERTYTNFYTIDWSSLSKNELEDIFASIKLEQIAHARNSVDTKHFKILRIKLRYEYRDDKNNLIHAFEISPEDYIDEPT